MLIASRPSERTCGRILRIICQVLLRVFSNPLILGVLVGLILNPILGAIHVTYPRFLVLMFDLVGNPMTPLGLLILGLFI